MNTSDILNKAADLIEERGWRQMEFWLGEDNAPLCIEGAMHAASGISHEHRLDQFLHCPAYAAVWAYLKSDPRWEQAKFHDRLYDWNDAPVRTASEVIEVLRACAVIEAAREEQDAAWETYAEVVSA